MSRNGSPLSSDALVRRITLEPGHKILARSPQDDQS
jgi:hypothetical protein